MDESTPDEPLADLLAQSDWIRRLASELSASSADAEDLEQETWIAALRNPPPRRGQGLRGWISSVQWNLAAMRSRTRRRREDRERLVAPLKERAGESFDFPRASVDDSDSPVEPIPNPTLELLLHEEERQILLDELLAMGADDRELLIARYFEDLTATDIAERRGTNSSLIRGKLRHARNRLRARLEARSQKSRRDLRVVIAKVACAASLSFILIRSGGSAGQSSSEGSPDQREVVTKEEFRILHRNGEVSRAQLGPTGASSASGFRPNPPRTDSAERARAMGFRLRSPLEDADSDEGPSAPMELDHGDDHATHTDARRLTPTN